MCLLAMLPGVRGEGRGGKSRETVDGMMSVEFSVLSNRLQYWDGMMSVESVGFASRGESIAYVGAVAALDDSITTAVLLRDAHKAEQTACTQKSAGESESGSGR